jgi:hypothetical protein
MAASRAWKNFEKKVADAIGGKRRGAVREGSRETDDIIHEDISIECKLLGAPTFSDMLAACEQAERLAPEGKLPIAVVGRKSKGIKNALVIMRFEKFLEAEDEYVPEIPDIEERFDAQQYVVPATSVEKLNKRAEVEENWADPGVIDDE